MQGCIDVSVCESLTFLFHDATCEVACMDVCMHVKVYLCLSGLGLMSKPRCWMVKSTDKPDYRVLAVSDC